MPKTAAQMAATHSAGAATTSTTSSTKPAATAAAKPVMPQVNTVAAELYGMLNGLDRLIQQIGNAYPKGSVGADAVTWMAVSALLNGATININNGLSKLNASPK